ncbi:Sec-independent protein translocase protein TatB [Sneathiella aquimaris]|uniref:Sec-independent protein translocase protein TatB n=1 Tax=Sneathiella aquimaris TaxID=2599305 RepID=UPI00146E0CDC|nr:Sec-independent protein translocase protein TatB [Sneathiella aquimaris]
MFDIGWSEMVFVVVIAVLVIGPKDLPRSIATVGKYIRKARSLARDFQSGLDDLAKETELDEIKKDIQGSTDFNLKKQVEDAVNPTGKFEEMFDDIKPEIKDTEPLETNAAPETPAGNSIAGDISLEDAPSSPETKVS